MFQPPLRLAKPGVWIKRRSNPDLIYDDSLPDPKMTVDYVPFDFMTTSRNVHNQWNRNPRGNAQYVRRIYDL